MIRFYTVYSKRGLWIEIANGTKIAMITGKKVAEECARNLSLEHKQKYWVEEVKVTKVK